MKKALKRWVRRAGVAVARKAATPYEALLDAPRLVPMTIELEGKPFRIPDGPSFYHSYREIFVERLYDFAAVTDSPRIIDGGSNVGTSVVFFRKRFPQAQIVAVEADPALFALLSTNLGSQGGPDIQILNRAIAARSGETVTFFQQGADGGRTGPGLATQSRVQVRTVALDDLIGDGAELLKLDIEGAETEAIAACRNLHRVDRVFVEYHSLAGEAQTLDVLLGCLRQAGFRYWVQGGHCSPRPFTESFDDHGLDCTLSIYAVRGEVLHG